MLTAQGIKAKAKELGFDLCGVAPVDSHPELDFLKDWLARGYAGEMSWLERTAEGREDVRNIHPGARSVIVFGTVYNTVGGSDPGSDPSDGSYQGCIARYAWGEDYHAVLSARMNALLAWMHDTHGAPFTASIYVDTGPVQERVYAQYAGLGWIGKNACLINPEVGSWLFLSEIITTLELEPDTQGLEQCGACTKCLEACPTGALVEPGVLDSNKCLSYLTIELKSAIPGELRQQMGTHVYGCDICQDVCPYNQAQPRSEDPAWQPRAGLAPASLVDLWRRSDTDLRRLVKGGPMTRLNIAGLRRNLAVAIGNSGDAEARAALDEPAGDRPSLDNPLVREHVDWARSR